MTSDRYKAWRQEVENAFANATSVDGSGESHLSPSGSYVLETSAYSTGPNTWNYSRGIVRRASDRSVVADIKRNYGSFWHAWVIHPNGNEYLLCGEDYQGYNVIELPSGRNQIHFPEEGFSGAGFCWVVVHPSPDGLTLAVDGCYWACPYELVFYDFSEPMMLPLRELMRIEDFEDTVGWDGADTFAYHRSEESNKLLAQWVRSGCISDRSER